MGRKEIDLDEILLEVGQFGLFQIKNFALILVPILFCAFYNGQYIFAAASVPYRCRVPECEASPPNFETNGWGSWALPDSGGRCERYVPIGSICDPGSFHPNNTEQCTSWVYSNHDSIVSSFDLACEEWKRTLVGTIRGVGFFFALPITAFISDTYGRRLALVLTAVAPAVVGLGKSFSDTYITFIILEFVEVVAAAGVYSSGFILALETMGLNRRVLGGNMISSTYALGQALLALIAWAIPEWRTFTRVIYVPSFLFIIYYFLLEESVRWLLSKGRKKEAVKIIFKAASVNKRKLSPETIKRLNEESLSDQDTSKTANNTIKAAIEPEEKQQSLVLQVLKSRVIMTRLLICSFWWISVTFIYYGISINSVSLAGNSYVNYILTSLVEIPGYILSILSLDRFGRKGSIMTAFFICGVALVSLPFVPEDQDTSKTANGAIKAAIEPEEKQQSLVLQVLKSRVLMTRLLICSFWWISVTFIYYGISINSVSLAGNSYVNYILTSLVEIPGYILSILSLDRFGRKGSIMTAFFICGVALVGLPFVPEDLLWLQTCLNLLGKLCISMVFSSIYIYTTELYPTTLRQSLLSVCSMTGRVGQVVAPQTPLLMEYMEALPYLVFGVMAFTSALLMLLTPETLNLSLPDNVNQAENIATKPRADQTTNFAVD